MWEAQSATSIVPLFCRAVGQVYVTTAILQVAFLWCNLPAGSGKRSDSREIFYHLEEEP